MTEDRRTWQSATPGEDPRERDDEASTDVALDKLAEQNGTVNPQEGAIGLGTSADTAPGRDLPDLEDAPDVPRLREES